MSIYVAQLRRIIPVKRWRRGQRDAFQVPSKLFMLM